LRNAYVSEIAYGNEITCVSEIACGSEIKFFHNSPKANFTAKQFHRRRRFHREAISLFPWEKFS
jgi:hypothetical protein